MAAPVNWDDPCARYVALKTAYYEAARGARKSISFQSGDTQQSVEYAPADMSVLKVEMDRAQRECEILRGVPSRPLRFAMVVGARRDRRAIDVQPGFVVMPGEPDGE